MLIGDVLFLSLIPDRSRCFLTEKECYMLYNEEERDRFDIKTFNGVNIHRYAIMAGEKIITTNNMIKLYRIICGHVYE